MEILYKWFNSQTPLIINNTIATIDLITTIGSTLTIFYQNKELSLNINNTHPYSSGIKCGSTTIIPLT